MLRSTATMLAILLSSMAGFGEDSLPKEVSPKKPVEKLGVGDHLLAVSVDQHRRTAIVHVPPGYDPVKPAPVVLALHGAMMTGEMMPSFTGLNETSDKNGFVVVYPNGTGVGPLLTWNAGGFVAGVGTRIDDLNFFRRLLDDLCGVINVDQKRVFVTGMSNGGMMSYRLAAEMSDRIAAIAPVGGTMPLGDVKPARPVSVIHFHGTLDTLVPFEGSGERRAPLTTVKSVEDSVRTWAALDGIQGAPRPAQVISKDGDELKVTRQEYGIGNEGSEVALIVVEGGGHTWPGETPPVKFLGKSTLTVSANDLMWAFFEKHSRK